MTTPRTKNELLGKLAFDALDCEDAVAHCPFGLLGCDSEGLIIFTNRWCETRNIDAVVGNDHLGALFHGADDFVALCEELAERPDGAAMRLKLEPQRRLRVRYAAVSDPSQLAEHHFWIDESPLDVPFDERLVALDRRLTLGSMSAAIAHHVNNPLASVRSNIEFSLRTDEQLRELLEEADFDTEGISAIRQIQRLALHDASVGVDRVDRVIASLGQVANASCLDEIQTLDLNETLEAIIGLSRVHYQGIETVTFEPGPVSSIRARGALEQAIHALVENAAQAASRAEGPGEVHISTRCDGDTIILEVRDSGPGFDDESLERAFEPFYTTLPPGEGLGLGLFVVELVAVASGGNVELDRDDDGTTVVRVRFLASEHVDA